MNYIELRKVVENSKITITELCKKIHIDRKTFYNNIENGNLKVETLEKICSILKVPINQFFTDHDQASEPIEPYKTKNLSDIERELLEALKELNECRKENFLLMNKLAKYKK